MSKQQHAHSHLISWDPDEPPPTTHVFISSFYSQYIVAPKTIRDKREKSRHFTLTLGPCHTFARPVPLALPGCHNQLGAQRASCQKVSFEARNPGTNSQLAENRVTLRNTENPAQHEGWNTQRSDEIYNSEFHCRGKENTKKTKKNPHHNTVSLNEALQTERGKTDSKKKKKQPEPQKCGCWGNATGWNQTPRKKYSSMVCNWASQFFLCSSKPSKRAHALGICNARWKAPRWKALQIGHQKNH